VLADVDPAALDAAARQLAGTELAILPTDVTRPEQLEALARLAYDRFGAVHLLFNNAGVGLVKPVAETTANDWRWVLGVNLWGVIHGIAAFLPRMQAQPDESRSETLAKELAAASSRVGVTVLCPAFFPTGISESERVRPRELANDGASSEAERQVKERLGHAVRAGRLSADDVAARALEGVVARERFVFTHPRIRLAIEARIGEALAACPYPDRS
jgi:NAD(P)-dependent dehydrogenase (short-subunit alcohol dehydrogenase family)